MTRPICACLPAELTHASSSILGGGSLVSAADLPRLEGILEGSEGSEGEAADWSDEDEAADDFAPVSGVLDQPRDASDGQPSGADDAPPGFLSAPSGALTVGGGRSRRASAVPTLGLSGALGTPSGGLGGGLGSARRRLSSRHSLALAGGMGGGLLGGGPPSARGRQASMLATTMEESGATLPHGRAERATLGDSGASGFGGEAESDRLSGGGGGAAALSRAALAEVVLRLEEQPRLVEVWTSHGTMANLKVSLWAPSAGDLPEWTRPCKQRFCVGHYGHAGSYKPPKVTPVLPELDDAAVWQPFRRGDIIDPAFELVAPHPRAFRRAWQVHLPSPQPSFYAWQPIPPGDAFVALGMVITRTDEPPPPSCVRCLHRRLCCPARTKPQFLWNDRGTMSGSAGSLWVVNNLGCIWATPSYEAPRGSADRGAFWEIREWPIRADQILPPVSPHGELALKGTRASDEDVAGGGAAAANDDERSAAVAAAASLGAAVGGGGGRRRAQTTTAAVRALPRHDSFGGTPSSAPGSPTTGASRSSSEAAPVVRVMR